MPANAGTQKLQRRIWLTAYAPLIIWTVFTLGLGSGLGSMNETSRFIRPLLEFLFPAADAETLKFYHISIRKLAHLFQYGVLGILALRVFLSARFSILYALVFVAAVAILDEVNQSFNPARTATPWDVFLDLIGATGAILLFRIAFRGRNKIESRQDHS